MPEFLKRTTGGVNRSQNCRLFPETNAGNKLIVRAACPCMLPSPYIILGMVLALCIL